MPIAFQHVQIIPLSDEQVSFQAVGGGATPAREVLRYNFSPRCPKPYIFPLIGPAGLPVTRVGHPHDPVGHRHHRSIWVTHDHVNGVSFWADGAATIAHDRIVKLDDGPEKATLTFRNAWRDGSGRALLSETRAITLWRPTDGEAIVDLLLSFTPATAMPSVTFGKTPFGFLGVRVARTMSVTDGGGTLRNSEGGVNEEGVFWKRARWMDFSGPILPNEINGVTVFDHPSNPRHPTVWHVRNEGWMGAAFCQAEEYVLKQGETLNLRYRLLAHRGGADQSAFDAQWRAFAQAYPP
ncbi:MAG: hypothetical protein FJ272_17540 [Planctomycetes bacterium]|nr:hypothetical protein [Planctomycetota bacterium]